MKEFALVPGGRRWHGDELVSLQKETLDATQGFLSAYGSCVYSGCVVSGSGPYSISAGFLGLLSVDGFKIVRFAGVTNLPNLNGYICLQKNINSKLYDNGTNAIANTVYDAGYYSSQPPGTITGSSLPVSALPTFSQAFASLNNSGWNSLTYFSSFVTGAIYYRKNLFTNTLQLWAELTSTAAVNTVPPDFKGIATLPAGYIPARTTTVFNCPLRYHLSTQTEMNYPGVPLRNIAAEVRSNGSIGIGLVKTSDGSTYTFYINQSIPLD